MLNHLPDIDTMVKTVGLPNVGIHCDYYHLHFCGDAPDAVLPYSGKIVHTHIAKVEKRGYVTDLEAMPDPEKDWEEEARENLRVLRSVFG